MPELQITQVVDVQTGWGDEFGGGGKYSRKLPGLHVTDPGLVLAFVAVRKQADSVVDESEPGVAAPIRYADTPMDLVVADTGTGGFSGRGAHCYSLRTAQSTGAIRWSTGRIGGAKADTSGRCAGIACVIPGGYVRDALPVKVATAESISATIRTEPGDLVISFLASGTTDYTDYPVPNGTVVGQNHMNEQKPVRGQLAVHPDGNVAWKGADGEQSLALVVLAISGMAPEPKEPPIEEPAAEEPPAEDHPARLILNDARTALIDAQTELRAATAAIDRAITEL